ncbi:murein biosynthesis integral membrane protein MurJ [Patescibacteria group bacterium]|nr:murein biosynthesis integral membrane protein MurJ [Patescibacteria group bacterium]
MKKFISKSKNILTSPQSSVLSAATIIMFMIVISRILGLVRQRTLAHFFTPDELGLFFAAFRLPDLVFEVLVFGTFSSAFIPVFTRSLKKGREAAWNTAATIVNIGLLVFVITSIILTIGAGEIYGLLVPGYSKVDQNTTVQLTRVLFAAQGFFVLSYVLTGVLESLKRFLVPALAPLFYNLGIILGIVFLTPKLGILAPAIGVVIGAFSHFLIQLPLAIKLGFRFKATLSITKDVRKIGKLALPRIIEVSFLQMSKMVELFFSSLISTAAYTYHTFGNSLQLLPVGIFGISIAKAALPTLSQQANSPSKFKKTLYSALYDMAFLIIPAVTILIVLRIPIVRLVYGTDIFKWEATVQTGYVLSAFALGILFQAATTILARSFYALHDTKTPVVISIVSILFIIMADYIFIKVLGFDVWGLAVAFSIGAIIQATSLFYLINKRLGNASFFKALLPMSKSVLAALGSGITMYLMLKVFDRSVWVKRLSFLGKIESTRTIHFEKFVLDTRYTANLLILTILVSLLGVLVYVGISILLRSQQIWTFFNLIKRIIVRRKVSPISAKKQEPIVPMPKEE